MQDNWGSIPVTQITKKLKRTPTAVTLKAHSFGLYDQMNQGDMMSLAEVTRLMGITRTRTVIDWIEKYGLKAKRRGLQAHKGPRDKNQLHYVIRAQDLLDWLEAHPDRWDSRRVPQYGLGVEYPWLKEKRRQDASRPPLSRPWTAEDLSRLRLYIQMDKSYSEIASILDRSVSSIKNAAYRNGYASLPPTMK